MNGFGKGGNQYFVGGHTEKSGNDLDRWFWTDGSPFHYKQWPENINDHFYGKNLGLKIYGHHFRECENNDWCKAHDPGDWACVNLHPITDDGYCLKNAYYPVEDQGSSECVNECAPYDDLDDLENWKSGRYFCNNVNKGKTNCNIGGYYMCSIPLGNNVTVNPVHCVCI